MRILAVTYGLPWPLTEGAKIRDYHLLRELAKDAEVVLLSFCKDDPDHAVPCEPLRFCREVETYAPPRRRSWQEALAHHRSARPLATFPFYFDAFARRIRALAERHQVDAVQIEHSFLAPYRTSIPADCRAILSLHNIGERQYASIAKVSGAGLLGKLKAMSMRGWEADWAARFDHCVTVSAQECEWLRQRVPGLPVTVIENGVDSAALRPLPPPASTHELLFVGTLGYAPNCDAVVQFVRRTLPVLQRSNPIVRLVVVGRDAPPEVRAMAGPAVEVHEDVLDVRPFYQRAAACVVPLRAGGGTRLKILEAMALGRPVISTPEGAEGLEVSHGNQLLIATDPAAMAAEISRVLLNRELAAELAARARRWVELRHDWAVIGARLRELHQRLIAHPAGTIS
jgi:glycosyltransferase involved in cell wall biosynthesis